jgi:anti-sigma factor RsiW
MTVLVRKVCMCPDRQIISLYVDGELPSPWDEKMEAHLESCEKCRSTLARYRSIRNYLSDDPEKTLTEAQERVWQKIAAPSLVISREPRKAIWSRNITLPLPAAAAAMVFIAVLAFVGVRALYRPVPTTAIIQDQVATGGIGLSDTGMVNIQDMAGVLQYLSSQDNGDFMVIRLPESRTFTHIGEPALINAADYSRRGLSR